MYKLNQLRGRKGLTQKQLADSIYETLKKNKVEVVLDDRDAKPGFKFKDWDLIGIPYMIVVGRGVDNGIVEVKNRYTNEKVEMNYQDAIKFVLDSVKNSL